MNEINWHPLPKQKKFIELPFDVKEALFGGAAGPGKSELIILLPILYEFFKIPGFKGIIFRRTFKQVNSELVFRAQKYYPATGGRYNDSKHVWKWPEYGSSIFFGHMEHEKNVYDYDTAEFQYIGFDELTSFTEFQYTYMFTRSRSAIRGLPSIIRGATNPGNIGHGWVRKRFVEPYRRDKETVVRGYEDSGIILNVKVGQEKDGTKVSIKRAYVHATMDDNTHLMENDPEYEKGVLALTDEAEMRSKRYGDWWTFSGQMFENWRPAPFPGEPDNARHVIEPFDIPVWWPKILCIDWGYAAMLWAGWLAVSPEKRVYLFQEYSGYELDVEVWSVDIRNLSQNMRFDDIVLDWNCFESRGEDQTIAEQFMDFSGLTPRPADKGPGSRISGQKLLKEYLRWKPRPVREKTIYSEEYAQYLLDTRGLEDYKQYMSDCRGDHDIEDAQILPKFQVFNTCPVLIETIPLCVRDEDNPEDVAEFEGDDPYDGIRYGIRAVKRLLEDVSDEAKKREKRAKHFALAATDQTAFQHLPKKEFDFVEKPISVSRLRRHRGRKRMHLLPGAR